MQNNVGILDTVTDEFTTVATTGEAAAGSGRGDGPSVAPARTTMTMNDVR